MSGKIRYFGREFPVWKTALHIHTTRSDGQCSPEEMIRMYEERGFDVCCVTDHRKAAPVSQWRSRMLLISGMEFHPRGPRGIPWHIVSYGLPEELEDLSDLPVQEGIDRVIGLGGLCHAAHPAWSEIRSSDIMELRNISGVEVYNSGADEIGRADSSQTMIELWSASRHLAPLGVDDMHLRAYACQAWTMVLSETRDRAGILSALKNGRVYASDGPDFYAIEAEGTVLHAEFSPCSQVFLMMPQWYPYMAKLPCRADRAEGRTGVYTGFTADLKEVPDGSYVEIELRDADGKRAWSAPFLKQDGAIVFTENR